MRPAQTGAYTSRLARSIPSGSVSKQQPVIMPKAAAKEKAPAKEKPAKKEKAPAKEKKEKKAKDPNAPKKNMGAYMWFCKDKRGEVKEAHPDWGVAEIGKEMGALWKKITDKDKKKYEAEAAKDKERYEKEMKSYKPKE
ncbi:hypothetical protein OEZ86_000126 [Tetradesmus obliquus]|nr:hypothetical protein OEZ86_000126 [Tetradesmus obliquus]